METKTIHMEYFAGLREKFGKNREEIEVKAETAEEVFHFLNEQYKINLQKDTFRVAVNDNFCSWDTALQSGDHLVFIPPMSGG